MEIKSLSGSLCLQLSDWNSVIDLATIGKAIILSCGCWCLCVCVCVGVGVWVIKELALCINHLIKIVKTNFPQA